MAASVWSASDASTNSMTLSNGGLTVATTTAPGWRSIRNTTSKAAGKVYVEFLVVASASNGNQGVGLGSAGVNIGSYLGASPYSLGIINGFTAASAGFTANVAAASLTYAVNDVWALAVDFTAGFVWLAKNNVWVVGNPAAGSSAFASFAPATVGPLFAGLLFNSATEKWTLQSTAASQKYAPPSGFGAWDADVVNYVDFAGNLGAASHYGRFHYGLGHYSRGGPLAPLFSSDLSILGFSAIDLVGGLTPTIVLAADLDVHVNLIELGGNLAPRITLGGSLSLLVPLDSLLGSFGFRVVYGDAEMISGPLWADSEPCPVPPWMAAPPCGPVTWSKSRLCNG